MKSRIAPIAINLAIVLALAAILYSLDWVKKERDFGPREEAKTNPFYAAQMFLRAARFKVESRFADHIFLTLPPKGQTLVFDGDRAWLSPSTREHLRAWVQEGGHLIIDTASEKEFYHKADEGDDDEVTEDEVVLHKESQGGRSTRPMIAKVLLLADQNDGIELGKRFNELGEPELGEIKALSQLDGQAIATDLFDLGIFARRDIGVLGNCDNAHWEEQQGRNADDASDSDDPPTYCDEAALELVPVESETRVAFNHLDRLFVEKPETRILAADEGGGLIAQARVGNGLVTVLTGLDLFDNKSIGWRDNAYLLYRLADQVGGTDVWFLSGWTQPSLWALLLRYGLPLMLSIALFLLLWMVRSGIRFGPLAERVEHHARSHAEHLRAASEFHWRRRDAHGMLIGLRELVRRRAALRYGRVDAIGRLATDRNMNRVDVQAAMSAAPTSERQLIEYVATLRALTDA